MDDREIEYEIDRYEDRRLEEEEELKKLYVGKYIEGFGLKVVDVIVDVHNPKNDKLVFEDGSFIKLSTLRGEGEEI